MRSRSSSCGSARTSRASTRTCTGHADCFFVLEGEAEFTLDDETHRFGRGSFVAAPIGTVHGFRNVGPGELRMLNLSAPNAGFAESLR
jgi:mannose-6-phosphate isomerase-like protein (cupin superfamily)